MASTLAEGQTKQVHKSDVITQSASEIVCYYNYLTGRLFDLLDGDLPRCTPQNLGGGYDR